MGGECTVSVVPPQPLIGPKALLAILGLVVAVAVGLFFNRPARLELGTAALAALIVLVGAVPSLLYARLPRREPLPLLPLIGLFYAAFFGAATLLLDIGWPPDQPIRMYMLWRIETIRPITLLLVLGGLVLLLACFYAARRWLFHALPYWRLPTLQPPDRVRALSWLLLIVHSGLIYIPAARRLPSVGQLLEPTALISYGIFYYLWWTKRSPRLETLLVFAVALPLELLYVWTKGGLADLFILPLFLLAVHIQATGRLPWKAVLAAVIVFLVAYNINATFRELTWHKNDPDRYQNATTLERAGLLARLFTDYVLGTDSADVRPGIYVASRASATDIFGPLIRRSALAVPTEKLMQATPSEVPYWGGESYRNMLTSFIPRIVWPGKPTEVIGSVVANRYGLTFSKEVPTAVNLPWVTELYVNFGARGVLWGMALIGVFLAFLDRVLNRPEMSPVEAVAGSALIFRLFYQESNFTVMTGSVLPLALFFWLYFWIGLRAPWPSFLRWGTRP